MDRLSVNQDMLAIEQIRKALTKALQPCFGKKLTEDSIENIEENIYSVLKSMVDIDLLNVGQNLVDRIIPLYNTWSIRKKIEWFFRMRIGFSKHEYHMFNQHRRQFENALFEGVPLVSQTDKEFIDEKIDELLSDFDDKFKKWWYVTNPMSIMICDIKITPAATIQNILINEKIDLQEEE